MGLSATKSILGAPSAIVLSNREAMIITQPYGISILAVFSLTIKNSFLIMVQATSTIPKEQNRAFEPTDI